MSKATQKGTTGRTSTAAPADSNPPADSAACDSLVRKAYESIEKKIFEGEAERIPRILLEDLLEDPDNSDPSHLAVQVKLAKDAIDSALDKIRVYVDKENDAGMSKLDGGVIAIRQKLRDAQCGDHWDEVQRRVERIADRLRKSERTKLLIRTTHPQPDNYYYWAVDYAQLLIAERVAGII